MMPALENEGNRTDIAALLSASYHFMIGRITDHLDTAGYSDLSKTQLHLLSRAEDGMSVGGLAQRIHAAPQIVTNLVQMLVENEYLSVQQDQDDINGTVVHFADRGRKALEIVLASQRAVENDWANTLGGDSYSQLHELLGKLFATKTHTHPTTSRS